MQQLIANTQFCRGLKLKFHQTHCTIVILQNFTNHHVQNTNHFQFLLFCCRRARTTSALAEKRSHHGLDKHQTVCTLNFKYFIHFIPRPVVVVVTRFAGCTVSFPHTHLIFIFTIFNPLPWHGRLTAKQDLALYCNYSQLQQAHNLPESAPGCCIIAVCATNSKLEPRRVQNHLFVRMFNDKSSNSHFLKNDSISH